MSYFPVFIELEGKKVLIIGGGQVALRRARELQTAKAILTVIAPSICKEIKKLGNINIVERSAEITDIRPDYFMTIIASNDNLTNCEIAKECCKQRIPVNRCDSFRDGDFICGKTMHSGKISVSTYSGGVPEMSCFIGKKIKTLISPELEKMAALLVELRPIVKKSKNRKGSVSEIMNGILTDSNLKRIAEGDYEKLRQEILAWL